MTPSEASRFCSANPLAEIIEEGDADWNYYSGLAGARPERYIIDKDKAPDSSE